MSSFDTMPRDVNGRLKDDAELVVTFSYEAITDDSGNDTDVPFISIVNPNMPYLHVFTIVTDTYKQRFPREWAAFEAGTNAEMIGTHLGSWTTATPAQVKTLIKNNVYTVEQLAKLSDLMASKLSMSGLKVKAQVFLDNQQGMLAIQRQQEIKAAQDREIELLRREIEIMRQAQVSAPSAPSVVADESPVSPPIHVDTTTKKAK